MSENKAKVEVEKPELSKEPRRQLTDRELASLIGGFIGVLADQAEDIEALKRAVSWWHPAVTPAAWEAIGMAIGIAESTRTRMADLKLNEKELELLRSRMGVIG